jgi:phosphinothricin acetyltransferase
MKEKIEILEAVSADYQVIAEIYNEFISLGTATMDETLKRADDIDEWVKKFHDREKIYVIKEQSSIIGWGIVKRYSDREGYRFTCETAVYLTANKVGNGYGTMMKKYLIDACKKLNYKHLVAKIFASNKGSIIYNEKLGYTIVGTQKNIGFKNNKWQDIVIMQYIIE